MTPDVGHQSLHASVLASAHTYKGTDVFVWVTVLRAYINWAEAKVILEEVTQLKLRKCPHSWASLVGLLLD